MDDITMRPVGQVRGGRAGLGDDAWDAVAATIELDNARFGPESLAGLADFSHVEVVFVFHRLPEDEIEMGSRHPRGRADWPAVGIFAQRAKHRPNRIGTTVCQLLAVREHEGALDVSGLDAVDGTPVLDVKPYMGGFAPRGEVREPAWAVELMHAYW